MDIKKIRQDCVAWIRDYFDRTGPDCKAVIGISGGKDSSIVAALCVEALGADRVVGVLMPYRKQKDIGDSYRVVEHLGIKSYEIDIFDTARAVVKGLGDAELRASAQARVNLLPRVRMTTLYAVAQTVNGRVANTCNLSENHIGFATYNGDAAGDFAPISMLTVTELYKLGRELGLPIDLAEKKPACDHGDDEDVIGFTYEALDRYIRTGVCEDGAIKARIDELERKNRFKLELMPKFTPDKSLL